MFLYVTKEEEKMEKNKREREREWMRKEKEKVGNRTTPSFNFLPVFLRSFLFLLFSLSSLRRETLQDLIQEEAKRRRKVIID